MMPCTIQGRLREEVRRAARTSRGAGAAQIGRVSSSLAVELLAPHKSEVSLSHRVRATAIRVWQTRHGHVRFDAIDPEQK
jgi:hypothetical protein